jgi:DedD protein
MEQKSKERLVGAAVLVGLAVIFVPVLFDETPVPVTTITATNIPPKPTDAFSSRIVPIGEPTHHEPREQSVVRPMPSESVTETEGGAPPVVAAIKDVPEAKLPKPKEPRDGQLVSERVGLMAWVVQLGSFSREANAQALNEKLRKKGYESFVDPVYSGGKKVFRVRVGPELVRSDADALREQLQKTVKLEGIVVRYP